MKKVQKTLTAALAATLATGIVGSVANAETVNEMYNAAYNATQNALAKKDQVSINEARAAIAKMPAEYKNHMSTFSALLDGVQQPIYVNILTALEKAQKENNQANINAARKMLVGVEQSYANTWSAELDKSQQALIKSAQDACEKATKSGDAKDIKEAQALLADIKTVEANEGVKTFIEKYETEFTTGLTITALDATVDNATSLTVKFNRELDKDSVKKENFILSSGNIKAYAKEVEVSEDKMSVTITLNTKLEETKEYSLLVKNMKDAKGVSMKEASFGVKYEKKDVKSIELLTNKVTRSSSMKDVLVVKDTLGRDISKEVKVTYAGVEDKNVVTKDGKISAAAKLDKEFTIKVTIGDFTEEVKVTVVKNLAEELVGFTLGRDVASKVKYADITPNAEIRTGKTSALTLFYKDALGKEQILDGAKTTKIESLTKDIVSVTGDKKLVGRKAGTALIRVQYGAIDETIEVVVANDVVADATLTIENTSLSVAKKAVPRTTTYKVVDNATGKTVSADSVLVKVWDDKKEDWTSADARIIAKDGVITINQGSTYLQQDTRAKLVVTYGDAKLEQEFEIAVTDAGAISSYELVASETALDQKTLDTSSLTVYALDDNGNRVEKLSNQTVKAELYIDSEKKENADVKSPYKVEAKEFALGSHTFYVVITNGSDEFTTNTVTVTVKNSDETKSTVESTTITPGQTIMDGIKWAYGTTTGAAITAIDFDYVDNSNVDIPDTGLTTSTKLTLKGEAKEGSVTIFVRSITIGEGKDAKVVQVNDNRTITVK